MENNIDFIKNLLKDLETYTKWDEVLIYRTTKTKMYPTYLYNISQIKDFKVYKNSKYTYYIKNINDNLNTYYIDFVDENSNIKKTIICEDILLKNAIEKVFKNSKNLIFKSASIGQDYFDFYKTDNDLIIELDKNLNEIDRFNLKDIK